jgi:hypothetical protein
MPNSGANRPNSNYAPDNDVLTEFRLATLPQASARTPDPPASESPEQLHAIFCHRLSMPRVFHCETVKGTRQVNLIDALRA